MANLTDAVAALLREPCGCFEQTSSSNYPLAMAQQYFMGHQGVDPRILAGDVGLFVGEDDLLLAVMERGVAIIVSYLEHQMAKENRPQDKVARWIEGTLAQVADPHLISMSRAVMGQMSAMPHAGPADAIMAPMRDLLAEPMAALGGPDPLRDADAVFQITAATMRRYVGSTEQPSADDIAHLVQFCLGGLAATREDGTR